VWGAAAGATITNTAASSYINDKVDGNT
jgi:hypothetical protein